MSSGENEKLGTLFYAFDIIERERLAPWFRGAAVTLIVAAAISAIIFATPDLMPSFPGEFKLVMLVILTSLGVGSIWLARTYADDVQRSKDFIGWYDPAVGGPSLTDRIKD